MSYLSQSVESDKSHDYPLESPLLRELIDFSSVCVQLMGDLSPSSGEDVST